MSVADRERALVAAVRAAPDDDRPRLVYADYLSERGDPRGELIQLSCARVHANSDADRDTIDRAIATLQSRCGETRLAGPIAGFVNNVGFTRGLVCEISLSWTQLAVAGERLFELCPLTALHIDGADEVDAYSRGQLAGALASEPGMQLVERLDLSDDYVQARCIAELLASPHLVRLRSLHLGDADSDAPLAAVVASAPLAALEELAFNGWMHATLGDDGARSLAASETLGVLRRLYLRNVALGPDGAAALARAQAFGPSLRLLYLGDGRQTRNAVGPRGARELGESRALRALEQLDLSFNDIGDEGAVGLAESEGVRCLGALGLAANGIGDRGVVALARSPRLATLQSLDLSHNEVGGAAVRELVFAPRVSRLERLSLYHTRSGSLGLRAIVESPHLAGLRDLSLAQTGLADADAEVLLVWPGLEQLDHLSLALNSFSPQLKKRLAARLGERVRL